jgi:DNA mismatch repair protein MutS
MPKKEALEEIIKMEVTECIIPEGKEEAYRDVIERLGRERITESAEWVFTLQSSLDQLFEHFRVTTLKGFGFDEKEDTLSICSAGAALQYLKETQKGELKHIIKITPLGRENVLQIDRASQVNLDLIHSGDVKERRNSLAGVLDFTRTAMGSRKLKQWILRPLTDCRQIYLRQEGVREFKEGTVLREEVKEIMSGIYDLERITSKLSTQRCNARDLVHLKNSLKNTTVLRDSLQGAYSKALTDIYEGLEQDGYIIELIEERIVDDPPFQITEGGILKEGINKELDELRGISKNGKSWITEYQQKERERTGIEKLKIGYNRVFGYYIEVTNLYKDKVPEDYTRKQTLTNSERFITPELKDYEQKVLSSEEKIRKIEYGIFNETRESVSERTEEILKIAALTSELDVLYSLGTAAYKYGYSAPVVDESLSIEIQDGCHPILLSIMPEGAFVPNDIFVNAEKEEFIIITGPNMSGKSTYIRQAAILVIMAQMGSFVPAKKAVIGVVDRLFTRIGASDEISRGQSTFMVEMTEVANILNNATDRSFIILDEVGRGTSTFDGVSIAWAMAEYIMEHIKARTLFATHYHELTEIVLTAPHAKNLNVSVKEWNDTVLFLHKIVEGAADKSYGIHVADIAGIPSEVIQRAEEVLENLELGSLGENNLPKLAEKREPDRQPVQLSIFDMRNERVLKKIKEIDINSITPIEALNILDSIQKEVE